MLARLKLTCLIPISFAILFGGNLIAQTKIDLTEGTLFLLGSLSAKYQMILMSKADHTFKLESDIGGGYFILDNTAIGISVPAKWNFTPKSGDTSAYGGAVGIKLFSTYFFNTDSVVFPYVGGNVTPQYSMTEKSFQLLAGLDLGILVSLSESVALDIGTRPEVFFKFGSGQNWKFTLPAGILGVRAVF